MATKTKRLPSKLLRRPVKAVRLSVNHRSPIKPNGAVRSSPALVKLRTPPKAARPSENHRKLGKSGVTARLPQTLIKLRPAAFALQEDPFSDTYLSPPATTEERLSRIQVLGQRIGGYIKFMCGVGSLNGSSAEAKEKSVSIFYDRLLLMEHELGRIHDNLRLG